MVKGSLDHVSREKGFTGEKLVSFAAISWLLMQCFLPTNGRLDPNHVTLCSLANLDVLLRWPSYVHPLPCMVS